MPPLTATQISTALDRLEDLHTMLTLDEAVEILTGKKPPLGRRICKVATDLWLDVSYAAEAPVRKVVDAIEGEVKFPASELELFLRRCRKVGFIAELGMEVPYYDIPSAGIRLMAADLRAILKGEAPLQFPDCIRELHRGQTPFLKSDNP